MSLREIETLRTKEELVNYFAQRGQRITEEEIEALKKSYEQAKGKDGSLTLEQLEYVAGGGVAIKESIPGRFHGDFLTRVGFVLLSHILLHPEIAKAHMPQTSVAALDQKGTEHQRHAVPEHPEVSTTTTTMTTVSTTEVDLHASVESQPLTTQVAGAQAQDYGRPTVDTLLEIEKGQEHFTFDNHGQEVTIPNSLVRALIAPEISHVRHESQSHIDVNNPDVRNVLLMYEKMLRPEIQKSELALPEYQDTCRMLNGRIHQIERGRLFNIVDKILGKEGLSGFINRQVTEQQHLLTDGFHLFKETKLNITQTALSALNRSNRGDRLNEREVDLIVQGILYENNFDQEDASYNIIINPEGKYCALDNEYNHAEVTEANYGCKVLHLSGRVYGFEELAAMPSAPADRTETEKALQHGVIIILPEPEDLAMSLIEHDENKVDAETCKDLFYVMNERNEKILIADGKRSNAITDEACNIIARDMNNYPYGTTIKWNGLVECTREENLGGKIVLSFINCNGIREYRTQNGVLLLERDSKENVISMYDSFFEMIGNEVEIFGKTTKFGLTFHYEGKFNGKTIFSFINPKGQKEVRSSDGSLLLRAKPDGGRALIIDKMFFKVYENQLESLRPGETLFEVFKYEYGAELNGKAKDEFGTVFSYIDQNGEKQYRNQRGEKFYKLKVHGPTDEEKIVKLVQYRTAWEDFYTELWLAGNASSITPIYSQKNDCPACYGLYPALFDAVIAEFKSAPVGTTAKLFPESSTVLMKEVENSFTDNSDYYVYDLDTKEYMFTTSTYNGCVLIEDRFLQRFKKIIWSKVKDLGDGESIDFIRTKFKKTSYNSFQYNDVRTGLTTVTVEDDD